MRSVLVASLRTHTRRYLAAVLAVVIGVSFIVVTAALSSAAKSGMQSGVAAPFEGADSVADGITGEEAAALVEGASESGAEAALLGWTIQPVRRDGKQVADEVDIAQITTRPGLRWQVLDEGELPDRAGRGRGRLQRGQEGRCRDRRPAPDRHRRRRQGRDRHRAGRLAGDRRLRAGLRHLGRPGHLGRQHLRRLRRVGRTRLAGRADRRDHRDRSGRQRAVARRLRRRGADRGQQRCRRAGDDAPALRRDRPVRLGARHRQHVLDPVRPAAARLRPAALCRRHPPPGAAVDPRRGARARRRLVPGRARDRHGARPRDRGPGQQPVARRPPGRRRHLPSLVRRRPGRRHVGHAGRGVAAHPSGGHGQPVGGAASGHRRRRPHHRGALADRVGARRARAGCRPPRRLRRIHDRGRDGGRWRRHLRRCAAPGPGAGAGADPPGRPGRGAARPVPPDGSPPTTPYAIPGVPPPLRRPSWSASP